MTGFKVGIVRLGRAAGKTKYCLLDEMDIYLVEDYRIEARVDVDPNGGGAAIFAWCFDLNKGRSSGRYLHQMLWEIHRGGIAPKWKVVHRNGITVDNRLENLTLVPESQQFVPEKVDKYSSVSAVSSQKDSSEESLYYLAVQQLPTEQIQDLLHSVETYHNRYYNANGEIIEEQDDTNMYYECHYAPCCNMEKELRQFSICGRCQRVRYCGVDCQQKDWSSHKRLCRERRRLAPYLLEREAER